ncbi:hypothetical protein ACSQ67_017440 [Phaseolus vulgaris]
MVCSELPGTREAVSQVLSSARADWISFKFVALLLFRLLIIANMGHAAFSIQHACSRVSLLIGQMPSFSTLTSKNLYEQHQEARRLVLQGVCDNVKVTFLTKI